MLTADEGEGCERGLLGTGSTGDGGVGGIFWVSDKSNVCILSTIQSQSQNA